MGKLVPYMRDRERDAMKKIKIWRYRVNERRSCVTCCLPKESRIGLFHIPDQ